MTEEADALQLGWLGTGRMGAAMVRRLLAHGCDVTVYNRTAAKAVPLVELGATAVGSISNWPRATSSSPPSAPRPT